MKKYLARFLVEAATPMRIGSGNAGLLVDQLVARDANQLPYVPGTSLAGVIRHELAQYPVFTEEQINRLFGFQNSQITQDTEEVDKGQGSRIVFSPALLVSADGQSVHESLEEIDFDQDYYRAYQDNLLPERDHVRMNHRGVASKYGKYEEQLVYQGTRFVFEMELEGTATDTDIWKQILAIVRQPTFRIGAGTRKGFGALKVIKTQQKSFNLKERKELEEYLAISSSLNKPFTSWEIAKTESLNDHWKQYELTLSPENFFLFGSGLQDAEADETPKMEKFFKWNEHGSAELQREQLLIPATSVKGALAHRVAFHFNQFDEEKGVSIETADSADWGNAILNDKMQESLNQIDFGVNPEGLDFDPGAGDWDELINEISKLQAIDSTIWKNYADLVEQKKNTLDETQIGVGEQNEAVVTLFGSAKKAEEGGQRGCVLVSDVFVPLKASKIFNHVAIDRFTGGGIDGALFQERVSTSNKFTLTFLVNKTAFDIPNVQKAWEAALDDLKSGQLQLGGHTTKGHGVFKAVS